MNDLHLITFVRVNNGWEELKNLTRLIESVRASLCCFPSTHFYHHVEISFNPRCDISMDDIDEPFIFKVYSDALCQKYNTLYDLGLSEEEQGSYCVWIKENTRNNDFNSQLDCLLKNCYFDPEDIIMFASVDDYFVMPTLSSVAEEECTCILMPADEIEDPWGMVIKYCNFEIAAEQGINYHKTGFKKGPREMVEYIL